VRVEIDDHAGASLSYDADPGEWSNGKTPPFGGARSRFESWLPSSTSPIFEVQIQVRGRVPELGSIRWVREHTFVPRRLPFNEAQARDAIARARNWTEALALLGYRNAGGNHATVKKYAALWDIPTDHFDPKAAILDALACGTRNRKVPLDQILVQDSRYSRNHLKDRLFAEGLKQRSCETCGQGELWRGRRISLILDHVNGVPNDNRIENLRILCPNCAATLDTHCGRNLPRERSCVGCGETFTPRTIRQRYCSFPCFSAIRIRDAGKLSPSSALGIPAPTRRKVERPPYEQLIREIEETSYLAVGRKYGVSDNAVRKWVQFYERERARLALDGGQLALGMAA
jgi:hypothetical protein